jgi:hypothetical protein
VVPDEGGGYKPLGAAIPEQAEENPNKANDLPEILETREGIAV